MQGNGQSVLTYYLDHEHKTTLDRLQEGFTGTCVPSTVGRAWPNSFWPKPNYLKELFQ